MKKTANYFNDLFGENLFSNLMNNPDYLSELLHPDKNAFDVLEEELNKLYAEGNLIYIKRLAEIKQDYKVLRNKLGIHKIQVR